MISLGEKTMSASGNLSMIGSSGPAVLALQLQLNSRQPTKLPPLKLDGIFGPRTFARVKEYQSNNGLNQDGIVGPLTSAKLAGRGNNVPVRSGTRCGNSYAQVQNRQR
jgi:peptidoglycan hydrolase-like protein with peptidoglycan-binding domain